MALSKRRKIMPSLLERVAELRKSCIWQVGCWFQITKQPCNIKACFPSFINWGSVLVFYPFLCPLFFLKNILSEHRLLPAISVLVAAVYFFTAVAFSHEIIWKFVEQHPTSPMTQCKIEFTYASHCVSKNLTPRRMLKKCFLDALASLDLKLSVSQYYWVKL